MANDDPTSLRMGFGHHQARRAGLGGVRPDRSPRAVNKITRDNKLVKRLLDELESDPDWKPFVVHWLTCGLSVEATRESLNRAKLYARYRARGYKREQIVDVLWPYF
jgi:hypothetical protein